MIYLVHFIVHKIEMLYLKRPLTSMTFSNGAKILKIGFVLCGKYDAGANPWNEMNFSLYSGLKEFSTRNVVPP